jgi:hypothetical protein
LEVLDPSCSYVLFLDEDNEADFRYYAEIIEAALRKLKWSPPKIVIMAGRNVVLKKKEE